MSFPGYFIRILDESGFDDVKAGGLAEWFILQWLRQKPGNLIDHLIGRAVELFWYDARIAMCLRDVVQMERRQIFDGEEFNRRWRKRGDNFQVMVTPIADFDPHSVALGLGE